MFFLILFNFFTNFSEQKKSKVVNLQNEFKDNFLPLDSDNNTESSKVNTIHTLLRDTNIKIEQSNFTKGKLK